MKNEKKQSILDQYESYEAVSAAHKAWITMRAIKEGKSSVMSHAGYKAAFSRIQRQTTITIIKEDGGYMGGCCSAVPVHHIVKARNSKVLVEKIGAIYNEIIEDIDNTSQEYKDAVASKDSKISAMIDDLKEIDIDGTTLQIISDPEYVIVS